LFNERKTIRLMIKPVRLVEAGYTIVGTTLGLSLQKHFRFYCKEVVQFFQHPPE
jgi:hypothetical protein